MPFIEAHISTSSIDFDLEAEHHHGITIDLFLQHNRPITFPIKDIRLFESPMNEGGLTFTDTETGTEARRNIISIPGPGHQGSLREDNKGCFLTLHPGQKHTKNGYISRIESGVGSIELPENSTVEEYKEAIAKQPKVWKWWSAENLENGHTYRVGIDKASTIKEWFEGSMEELLCKPLAERTDEKMKKEPIVINVTQPAEFTMKRPDSDGSLDWP
ncbi:uncharacterized protein FPRO_05330 [Fusarium proliferatum ET1]|uniref:Uncharacterized protein n=1 Tax=Fusarium proliferatum (strain ET1) TaxID=1227346 RepID=A0A1L7VL78_FUSPR|nr:uncharacterized protein FPRO_05330 [Fusarium proliferatum ET1]CZR40430.1 uncharacterized protein FPRO_05330 [Fusarium proliferatum ET1]